MSTWSSASSPAKNEPPKFTSPVNAPASPWFRLTMPLSSPLHCLVWSSAQQSVLQTAARRVREAVRGREFTSIVFHRFVPPTSKKWLTLPPFLLSLMRISFSCLYQFFFYPVLLLYSYKKRYRIEEGSMKWEKNAWLLCPFSFTRSYQLLVRLPPLITATNKG